MMEQPTWQPEAARLAAQKKEEIQGIIRRKYGNDATFYVGSVFGEDIPQTLSVTAAANYDGSAPWAIYFQRFLLNYALNRSVFNALTKERGYVQTRIVHKATGTEAVALMTASGSMVFGDPGSLTSEGVVGYLPVANRISHGQELRTSHARGKISVVYLPTDIPRQEPVTPILGRPVIVSNLTGQTSPIIEVALKYPRQTDASDISFIAYGMESLQRGR